MRRFIIRSSILCQFASSYTIIPSLCPPLGRIGGGNGSTGSNTGVRRLRSSLRDNNNDNNNRIRSLKEEARHRRVQELLRIQARERSHRSCDGSAWSSQWTEKLEKELRGLQSKGDPYDAGLFTQDHAAFKRGHNQVFVHLAQKKIVGGAGRRTQGKDLCVNERTNARPVFYLDGKDGATTMALLEANFDRPTELFMANEWSETVAALRAPPFEHVNCHFGSAQDSLLGRFQDVPFVAAYLDGCGGSPDAVIQMISALLSAPRAPTLFIGFTLTAAEPSGRELIDRVQDVTKATLQLARQQGYQHMDHVMDDPLWFGIDPALSRKHQETTTCWVVCWRKDVGAAIE